MRILLLSKDRRIGYYNPGGIIAGIIASLNIGNYRSLPVYND
jgi:hypothetical protein